MSAKSFIQSDAIDINKERDWAASLGQMDWDSTSIVFTKRSLIEFLKYTGVTVNTNYSNISKLPRYAQFGKLSASSSELLPSDIPGHPASTSADFSEDPIRSSQSLTTTPGGQSSNIFGEPEFGDDALSLAPQTRQTLVTENYDHGKEPVHESLQSHESANEAAPAFNPSRRVRTAPGGKDSLTDLWGTGPIEEFKPTRRVRQPPGGHDNMAGIL